MSASPAPQVVVVQVPYPKPRRSNRAGVTGFVLSLLGLLTCGILSPLALLFSSIGLLKRPRGMATAGFLLSGMGTLFIGSVISGIVLSESEAREHHVNWMSADTARLVAEANQAIEAYRSEHGSLPDGSLGRELIAGRQDAWGRDLSYVKVNEELYEVASAGPDGEFGNEDDVTQNDIPPPGDEDAEDEEQADEWEEGDEWDEMEWDDFDDGERRREVIRSFPVDWDGHVIHRGKHARIEVRSENGQRWVRIEVE
jgi:hypothetical protein